jgi:hypothetical protein
LLSAVWLSVQLYGYLMYEIPHKRAKLRSALRELEEEEALAQEYRAKRNELLLSRSAECEEVGP